METAVEISPGLGIAIMMNNYFHDVATAMLLAASFALWVLMRTQRDHPGREAADFFLDSCRRLKLLVKASLVWIVLGGIPRTIFYKDFEWANAAGKNQVPALIAKHVMVTILLVAGTWGWIALRRRMGELENGSDGGRPVDVPAREG